MKSEAVAAVPTPQAVVAVLHLAALRPSDPQTAEAAVVFTNMGETKRQTLKLVKEGPMWRVSDVLVPGRPALTEQLMAAIS